MSVVPRGIPRGRPRIRRAILTGRQDPASLAADVKALEVVQLEQAVSLDEAESRLARRINEMMLSGPLAQRPPAGVADRLYFATDGSPNQRLYWDTGTQWMVA